MIVAGAYEQRLLDDFRWALSEGSRHFDEKSAVSDALRKIARRLDELQVPYAIVGGMALFKHGFRRFTDGVDVLVRKADLKLIHDKLLSATSKDGKIPDLNVKVSEYQTKYIPPNVLQRGF